MSSQNILNREVIEKEKIEKILGQVLTGWKNTCLSNYCIKVKHTIFDHMTGSDVSNYEYSQISQEIYNQFSNYKVKEYDDGILYAHKWKYSFKPQSECTKKSCVTNCL